MNLVFLNPLYLLGSLLALIPLLIHIFYKRRIQEVRFPSLMFLKISDNRNARLFRLRELLLLLIRMLIILFLVMAVAGPVMNFQKPFKQSKAVKKSGSRAIVLIVDNSMSMGYRRGASSVLEEAVERSKDILELFMRPGDTVAVIPAAGPGHILYNELFSRETALEALDRIPQTLARADMKRVYEVSIDGLRQSYASEKICLILSDMQNSMFSNMSQADPGPGIRLILIDLSSEDRFNALVDTVQTPPVFYSLGREAPIFVRLKNTGERGGTVQAEAHFSEKKIFQEQIDLLPGGVSPLSFRFNPEKEGYQTGRIELEGDNLKGDNVRYFLDRVRGPSRVLLVGSPSETSYLLNVLESYPEKGMIIPGQIRPSELGYKPGKADLIIMTSFRGLREAGSVYLKKSLQQGSPLMLTLGESLDFQSYQDGIYLQGITPVRLLNRIRSEEGTSNTDFRIRQADWSHPVLSLFKEHNFFPLINIRDYYRVEYNRSDPDIHVLLRMENSSPFLMETAHKNEMEQKAGRVFIFTSGLSGEMNDIVYHPNFPALFFQIMKYLLQDRFPVFYAGVNRELVLNVLGSKNRDGLEKYEDQSRKFKRYEYPFLNETGVYQTAEGKFFLINTDPSESDLSVSRAKDLKEIFPTALFLENEADFESRVQAAVSGVPLSPLLIILCLIFLALEAVLANRLFRENVFLRKKAGN